MSPKFLLPQYWPTWIGLALLRLAVLLPFPWLLQFGGVLGLALRKLPFPGVRTARRNLALCLPDLSVAEREAIHREHFRNLGMALFETALVWWSSGERILAMAHVEGLEHLDAALARGKGAIVLAAHFTTLEIGARLMTASREFTAMYRPPRNQLLGYMLESRRRKVSRQLIARDEVRAVIRALRENQPVWYAPDQSYRKKGAEMVPFFGIPCATNTATSRLAQMTGAAVLPYFVERLPGTAGYVAKLGAPLEDFPSNDSVADAQRFHLLIENHIRQVPAQYLWIHRRFKGLTPDYPNHYY